MNAYFIPLGQIVAAYSTRLMALYSALVMAWLSLPDIYQNAILAKVDPAWVALVALAVLFYARIKNQGLDPTKPAAPPSTLTGVL